MDQQGFAEAVLRGLGAPVTPANLEFMMTWQRAEGGHWNNSARYNPLNTTLNMPGSGNTGTQGNISVYNSWGQGVAATVRTLELDYYDGLRKVLKTGSSAMDAARALAASPWGTGDDVIALLAGGNGPAPKPRDPSGASSPDPTGDADPASTAGDVVKTLTGAFSPFRLLSGDWSEDVARLAMTGAFVVGGIALVVLGFWRGVAPAAGKVADVVPIARAGKMARAG